MLQGSVAMRGTFIDAIIACTMTAMVIVISGLYPSGQSGVAPTMRGFDQELPDSAWLVTLATVFFTGTRILGWGHCSESCPEFLVGTRAIRPFRVLRVVVVVTGAVATGGVIGTSAEILNGRMAILNLIGLLLLSGSVFRRTRAYDFKAGERSA